MSTYLPAGWPSDKPVLTSTVSMPMVGLRSNSATRHDRGKRVRDRPIGLLTFRCPYSARPFSGHQKRPPDRGPFVIRFHSRMPRARLELARCCHRGILSPLRLPVPPSGPTGQIYRFHPWCTTDTSKGMRCACGSRSRGRRRAQRVNFALQALTNLCNTGSCGLRSRTGLGSKVVTGSSTRMLRAVTRSLKGPAELLCHVSALL